MSDSEYKITDTQGKFMQVVRDGRKLNDADWTPGRLILSNRRLVLVGNGGKRTIPLSKVGKLGGRHDANQTVARVSGYVSLRFGKDVILVAAADHDEFELDLYRALLDQRVVLARHPAVAGGVVQDTEWEKGRLKVDDDALNLALQSGTFVELDLDDIGTVTSTERTVFDEKRLVLEAEHTEGSTSVQTHLSGSEQQCLVMESFLKKGEERSKADIDLSERENEVLMALYSGVSPFEIPTFLGMDVDDVEDIFERLVDLEVVEEVRIRREVALKPRGRNIASEAMNQQ
ncbi:hypothetical protein SAMN04487949_1150 [Halogranum gelatinilyticum]|uniref:Taxis protein CheF n=1 Tax=Halogranum gelatinilyticum TaxID=660521 RepID=A0A1G9R2T4_9EURY|nr:CheF family chemotaxis protein [Halogranum gelatinilyticum]SDM17559.1 hypothetical protein SAMN04487949_1150 [Halogranum gelatinilyticum]